MPWFRRVMAGVDIKSYFRAELDCGCVFIRLKGVEPCAQHANDAFFLTTFVRIMSDLARDLDRVEPSHAEPGLQGDVTP